MPSALHESVQLIEASDTTSATSGKMKVQAISPGLGSSGYYSPAVLEEAAKNKLIRRGTPVHFDHASESERHDRPERSVRDIAGAFTEDAQWDGTALVGEVQVFAPYRDLVAEMAPYIGLSITGSATDITVGDVDGKQVPVIEGLHAINSVDLVTRAGRGGMFLLESVRPSKVNHRAIGHGVAEATVNDTREALQTVLRDEYGGEKTYVWVRDFDESAVWFEVEVNTENASDSGTYGQPYTSVDGAVALFGERAEVRVVTNYVPVTRPGNITTEESEEDPMAETKIEEARLHQLENDAGRVSVLESERDTEKARADKAEAKLAERDRTDQAAKIIGESAGKAKVEFTALERRGLLAGVPVGDDGKVAVEAFTKTVDEAATEKAKAVAEAAERNGAGQVFGNGARVLTETDRDERAESDKAIAEAFGRPTTKITQEV